MVIEQLKQIAKLKSSWNLAPFPQIVQKIPKIYCSCLYYQLAKFGDLMSCGSNDIFKKAPCHKY